MWGGGVISRAGMTVLALNRFSAHRQHRAAHAKPAIRLANNSPLTFHFKPSINVGCMRVNALLLSAGVVMLMRSLASSRAHQLVVNGATGNGLLVSRYHPRAAGWGHRVECVRDVICEPNGSLGMSVPMLDEAE